jgi:predicted RNA-binding protein with PIN domain
MESARLEHRHLRSALEFVVALVAEGQKRRPALKYPAGLKPYLKMQRLPAAALGPVRRAIEADDEFRRRVAVGAVPEVIDDIGMLWLQRPDGWAERVDELVDRAADELQASEEAAAVHREARRRRAAEQAVARARAEVVELEAKVDALTADLEQLRAEFAELDRLAGALRSELGEARTETRHANDRAAAAATKLEQLRAERDDALRRMGHAVEVRDEVIAARSSESADAARLAGLAAMARELADELGALGSPNAASEERAARRRALALPGGVLGDSLGATEFLLRAGATVLLDGYNLAKLRWPDLDLPSQRRVLLDVVENVARRYGADLTVVFDGADVVGASADQRRLVRVVYSPEGVTADDVIRAEVSRLPASRQVVVVTNDAAIVRDVRQLGANTVSSDRFLATACTSARRPGSTPAWGSPTATPIARPIRSGAVAAPGRSSSPPARTSQHRRTRPRPAGGPGPVARYAWVDHYEPLRDRAAGDRPPHAAAGHRAVAVRRRQLDRRPRGRPPRRDRLVRQERQHPRAGGRQLVRARVRRHHGRVPGGPPGRRRVRRVPALPRRLPDRRDRRARRGRRPALPRLARAAAGHVPRRVPRGARRPLYGCDDCQEVCPPTVRLGERHRIDARRDDPAPRRGSTCSTSSTPPTTSCSPATAAGTSPTATRGGGAATRWSCSATSPIRGRPRAHPPHARPLPCRTRPVLAEHADWAARRSRVGHGMKHLLVTNDFPPKIGGIQSLLWEWWRRLPPDRFAVLTSPYQGRPSSTRPAVPGRARPEPVLLPHP